MVIHRLPQHRRGVQSLRDCRHWRTQAPLDYRGPSLTPRARSTPAQGGASSFAVRLLGLQPSHLPEFRKRFRLANVPSRVPNELSSERRISHEDRFARAWLR
jgi:hypothetical protein